LQGRPQVGAPNKKQKDGNNNALNRNGDDHFEPDIPILAVILAKVFGLSMEAAISNVARQLPVLAINFRENFAEAPAS
jgi:hypothetical protein